MGFIKDLGKMAGSVAGIAIGAPISLVGEVIKSDFIQEIGRPLKNLLFFRLKFQIHTKNPPVSIILVDFS